MSIIYWDFDGYVISAIEGYDKPRKELFDIAKNLTMTISLCI